MERYLKKDLIIGHTSQVALYMNPDITRVNSRNIPDWVYEKEWGRVYLCFAEQRTRFASSLEYKQLFYDINVKKTNIIVERIKSEKIIFFSTTELWNHCHGSINLETDYCFNENYYTDSKLQITKKLQLKENVIILYPFNFNSKYRGKSFLFGKIYDSIMNKKKIQIGSTYFYREILHAKYVARQAESAMNSQIIGSGRLVFINDYIKDLYEHAGLSYYDLVRETEDNWRPEYTFWFNSNNCLYPYDKLLKDSLEGI